MGNSKAFISRDALNSVEGTGLPQVEGGYLCIISLPNNHEVWEVLCFTTDLSKYVQDAIGPGFYDYDSEWGYYQRADVTRYLKLEELN